MADLTAPATNRAKLQTLQQTMLAMPDEQKLDIDAMTKHHFADKAYIREMIVPAGVVVVGKIHKTRHTFILLEGECTLFTENGKSMLKAPHFSIADPGMKRSVFTHTVCRFLNIHGTTETDLDAIEAEVICPEIDAIEVSPANVNIEGQS